jgi:hypothetical protein
MRDEGSAKAVAAECEAFIGDYLVLCRKTFNYMQSVAKRHNPNLIDHRPTDT